MTVNSCLQTITMKYEIRPASWERDHHAIRRVRETVFVVEQAVDPELEWDGLDESCDHAVVELPDGSIIGTGRLVCVGADGKIGRMAVLQEHRGKGVGMAILQFLVEAARERGMHRARLNAQTHALAFYARAGFVAEGPEFDEADIPHRHMTMEL